MVAEDELSIGLGSAFYAIGAAGGGGGGGGGVRGLTRSKERKRPIGTAVNREGEHGLESEDQSVVMAAAAGGNGGGGSSELPTPVDGLPENGPPPFLTKTYEMVEDPETDPIVSWADGSNNFVVWDAHNFAMNLLPKYFKHSNFSSFIRQLNTYGFKKVHLDRWEFGNAGFQRGKKHMLKNIKRRYRSSSSNDSTNKKLVERETEIERLKKENDMLKLEILDLKRQQEGTDKHVADLEEFMRCVLVMLIAKSMGQVSFVQKLFSKYKQRVVVGSGGVPKKHRVMMNESNEILSSLNPSNKEKLAEMQCEKNSLLGSNQDGDSSPTQEQQNTNPTSQTSSLEILSNYIELQLMEDDAICESERNALGGSQSKFLHGFKDSLINHSTWE